MSSNDKNQDMHRNNAWQKYYNDEKVAQGSLELSIQSIKTSFYVFYLIQIKNLTCFTPNSTDNSLSSRTSAFKLFGKEPLLNKN